MVYHGISHLLIRAPHQHKPCLTIVKRTRLTISNHGVPSSSSSRSRSSRSSSSSSGGGLSECILTARALLTMLLPNFYLKPPRPAFRSSRSAFRYAQPACEAVLHPSGSETSFYPGSPEKTNQPGEPEPCVRTPSPHESWTYGGRSGEGFVNRDTPLAIPRRFFVAMFELPVLPLRTS